MNEDEKTLVSEFLSKIYTIDEIQISPADWAKCINTLSLSDMYFKDLLENLNIECIRLESCLFKHRADQFTTVTPNPINWKRFITSLFRFDKTKNPQYWHHLADMKMAGENAMPSELLRLAAFRYAYTKAQKGLFGQEPERVKEFFDKHLNIKFEI